jgi:error-prone DNA polymerase
MDDELLRVISARKGWRASVREAGFCRHGSFALYGFPESHAASFALVAYASAWLKCYYLAALTAVLF